MLFVVIMIIKSRGFPLIFPSKREKIRKKQANQLTFLWYSKGYIIFYRLQVPY